MQKILCLLLLLLVMGAASFGDPPVKGDAPPLYDVKADANTQIKTALAQAGKGHKNVLVQFGANWCGWCHKLDKLFASDKTIAAELKKNYVVVLVDVDKEHNADVVKKYGNPAQFGLPVIIVLDKDGKQLTTQDTGKLEEGDHHDPAKVLAFLKQWAPGKASEKTVLSPTRR